VATIFRLTITIGKGEAAREREISLDPGDISMGLLEDLQSASSAGDMGSMKPIISELFGLTNEEYRALTIKQFIEIAAAIPRAVNEASTIPNA